MTDHSFADCPRCGKPLQAGFANKAVGLSFVAPEKLERFLSVDEDLAEAGPAKFLPSKAEYFRSYLCRACELYVVDYSVTLDRSRAKQVAETLGQRG